MMMVMMMMMMMLIMLMNNFTKEVDLNLTFCLSCPTTFLFGRTEMVTYSCRTCAFKENIDIFVALLSMWKAHKLNFTSLSFTMEVHFNHEEDNFDSHLMYF